MASNADDSSSRCIAQECHFSASGSKQFRDILLRSSCRKATRALMCAVALAAISGCAQIERGQALIEAAKREVERTVPTCSTDRECEVKWAAARSFVLGNSRMRLQTVTGDFLETFNSPSGEPGLAWRVVKQPFGANGYEIRATAWCGNMFGCVPNALQAMIDFNRTVNASWAPDAPARPPLQDAPPSIYELRPKPKF